MGNKVEKNWNGELKPVPNETGFDYSFIFPATANRVPSVFVENDHIEMFHFESAKPSPHNRMLYGRTNYN